MKWLFFLFFATVCWASSRSNAVDLMSLVTAPNYIFWNHSAETLAQFFKDINFLKERLRQPFGTSFAATRFPRDLPHLNFFVAQLIQRLSKDEISEMIAEGNPAITSFFFGKRFNAFEHFDHLTLPESLPNLHLIPLEELNSKNLSKMPLDALVQIFLARSSSGLLNKRWELFRNLPDSFWNHQQIQFNAEVLNLFSPLALPDFADYRIIDYSMPNARALNAFDIFSRPFAPYFHAFFRSDYSTFFNHYRTVKLPQVRAALAKNLVLTVFHLQAIVHVMVMTDKPYMPLLSLISTAIGSIKTEVQSLSKAFPSDPNVLEMMKSCQTCYSSLLVEHLMNTQARYHHMLKSEFFPATVAVADLQSVKSLLGLPEGPFSFEELEKAKGDSIFWPVFMLLSPSSTVNPELAEYIDVVAGALNRGLVDISQFNLEEGLCRNFKYLLQNCPQASKSILLPIISNPDVYAFKDLYSSVAALVPRTSYKLYFNVLVRPFFLNRSVNNQRPLLLINPIDFASLQPLFSGPASDILQRYRLPEDDNAVLLPASVTLPTYRYLDLSRLQPDLEYDLSYRIVLKNSIISLDDGVEYDKVLNYAFTKATEALESDIGCDQLLVSGRNHSALREKYELCPPFQVSIEALPVNYEFGKVESMTLEALTRNALPGTAADSLETPQEIAFIEEVLGGLGEIAKNPLSNWQIVFSNSVNLSGVGPLIDTLHAFGKAIVIPELRSFNYIEAHGGFVPAPFLCPRVMAFVGIWIAACLKTSVTLPWQFSQIYLRFLLYDWPNNSDSVMDALVNDIYAPIFSFIDQSFELMQNDKSFDVYLPLQFHPHRMFSIPQPYQASSSPFIFESNVLELNHQMLKTRFNRSKLLALGSAKYSSIFRSKLKDFLLQGRLEFQRHFRLLFSSEFTPNSSFRVLSPFFASEPINVDELIASINVTDGVIRNDLPSALTESISTKDLLTLIIRGYSRKELEKFLWFIIGSSNPPIGGFKQSPIDIRVFSGSRLSTSRVCFRIVNWYVNFGSARDTLKNLQVSIEFASGFLENE